MKTSGPQSTEPSALPATTPATPTLEAAAEQPATRLPTPTTWPAGTGKHPKATTTTTTTTTTAPATPDSNPATASPAPSPPQGQYRVESTDVTNVDVTDVDVTNVTDVEPHYIQDMVELEHRFERAVPAIEMVFQPIVHARDYSIFGYEALLRSKDPDLPHPGALLDAAERLNRTSQLGRHVRAHVSRVFAQAEDSRGYLFVNLHALDLLDKTLSSPFSPLAKIAHRVVLEVTERTSLSTVSDIRYRVAELRAMGYRIAIDDLGAGHSRMDLFTPLDTDLVKLDMSLVRDIDSHPMKQELVASLIKLCQEQNILVIGEGVETEAEADYLIEVGCDLLQGYLIARPAPPFVTPPRRGA